MTLIEKIGRQGFGAMRLGRESRPGADHDPARVINAALDAGITMVDTADMYGNEALVGKAIRGRNDEVVLCSKFGVVWAEGGDWSVRADAAYVRQACEASLHRLGVEVIDLYYLHHRSDTIPIEETAGAMAELVAEGKVRALGLSNVTEEDVRRAHAVHPVVAVQEEWSLVQRELEQMVPTLAELGVLVVAHSPIGHGVLHAPVEDASGESSYAALRAELAGTGTTHGVSPGQAALAWVHHQQERWGLRVVPLPGTTRVSHVRANIAAIELALSDAELARLDQASGRL